MKFILMLSIATAIMFHSSLSYAAVSRVMVCDARERIVAKLTEYNESQSAIGLIKPTELMEIFVSNDGSWTIIATNPAMRSCIIMAGKSFSIIPNDAKATGLSN